MRFQNILALALRLEKQLAEHGNKYPKTVKEICKAQHKFLLTWFEVAKKTYDLKSEEDPNEEEIVERLTHLLDDVGQETLTIEHVEQRLPGGTKEEQEELLQRKQEILERDQLTFEALLPILRSYDPLIREKFLRITYYRTRDEELKENWCTEEGEENPIEEALATLSYVSFVETSLHKGVEQPSTPLFRMMKPYCLCPLCLDTLACSPARRICVPIVFCVPVCVIQNERFLKHQQRMELSAFVLNQSFQSTKGKMSWAKRGYTRNFLNLRTQWLKESFGVIRAQQTSSFVVPSSSLLGVYAMAYAKMSYEMNEALNQRARLVWLMRSGCPGMDLDFFIDGKRSTQIVAYLLLEQRFFDLVQSTLKAHGGIRLFEDSNTTKDSISTSTCFISTARHDNVSRIQDSCLDYMSKYDARKVLQDAYDIDPKREFDSTTIAHVEAALQFESDVFLDPDRTILRKMVDLASKPEGQRMFGTFKTPIELQMFQTYTSSALIYRTLHKPNPKENGKLNELIMAPFSLGMLCPDIHFPQGIPANLRPPDDVGYVKLPRKKRDRRVTTASLPVIPPAQVEQEVLPQEEVEEHVTPTSVSNQEEVPQVEEEEETEEQVSPISVSDQVQQEVEVPQEEEDEEEQVSPISVSDQVQEEQVPQEEEVEEQVSPISISNQVQEEQEQVVKHPRYKKSKRLMVFGDGSGRFEMDRNTLCMLAFAQVMSVEKNYCPREVRKIQVASV